MKQILGNHPITTVLGYIVAALLIAQTAIPAYTNPTTHSIDWLQVIEAIAVGMLGRKVPDSNNTVTKS